MVQEHSFTDTTSAGENVSRETNAHHDPGVIVHFGSIIVAGLIELGPALILSLFSGLTYAWQGAVAFIIILTILLAGMSIASSVLLLRSREWILHTPGIFLACGAAAGLIFMCVRLCQMTVRTGRLAAHWPLFGMVRTSLLTQFSLSKALSSFARTWLYVSIGVLALMIIAGFLYEMFRRDRSSLIISLGTILLFGAAGWCASGWLFLPLYFALFSGQRVLLLVAFVFVFALALLTGARMVCVSPHSLPARYASTNKRSIIIVLSSLCVALLGLLLPIFILL